ncbi:DNA repair protein RadA [Staphylococcus gallinarum]|uniref:DNA repair protein RadA n=2 Tax=Staphylococcus gallinarum TaxID=1293 RepID=A0A0D0SP69_STAGA|nr:DNA repair protein RadA [Staphylococcus gallinarum]KIR12258.1 DNA repair protein RadA [Staphylococcus gallinarum]MBU7218747.1 DNA repair protein RadA [Staphylococcus gallinarum]MCD8787171.1 DNA repair protein RadA [Staphylococcus gallinarum]MCD8794597.1 DNA repair protein RadA [Staphylococcus gallinarum]MCD8821873.1 DNA repair protein RadA [Staphylococcus gallinarum]
MAKKKVIFECMACGYQSPKWMGKCPNCGGWNQMEEIVEQKAASPKHGVRSRDNVAKVQKLNDIQHENTPRIISKSAEFNRVLGGGIVNGSLVLIGGDPGIGKSTLLLQVCAALSQSYNVLYITGEESLNQTKLRAERLDEDSSQLNVFAETDLEVIHETVKQLKPDLLVVDSIQTIFHPEINSAPGSVSQVRESTQSLMNIAKQMNIATFIVGHVTKEGQIAGPRLLEHMVDTVLYFEGDEHHAYRILRAVKNRFGSTNEMGIFEMKQSGLKGVKNPSEMFLEERSTNVPGSTIVSTMEGTRPLLIEVQALVTPTTFNNPRRMATGIDHNRLSLLMAVLEKKENYLLQQQDAYIKVAGGVRLTEPAVDLGIIVATASSFKDLAVDGLDCFIGEVGLTGEVRRVSRIEQRVQEAAKLGFKRVIIPETNIGGWQFPEGIKVIGVKSVHEALKYAINKQ